jgi:hypothetical protein
MCTEQQGGWRLSRESPQFGESLWLFGEFRPVSLY